MSLCLWEETTVSRVNSLKAECAYPTILGNERHLLTQEDTLEY